MTRIRTLAIAAASLALVATASATPANAGGKHLGAALLGGFVAGALITHATNNAYAQPYYSGGYVQKCWWQSQFVGYDYYGNPVYQKVKVCG
jgi:hypothetical protein